MTNPTFHSVCKRNLSMYVVVVSVYISLPKNPSYYLKDLNNFNFGSLFNSWSNDEYLSTKQQDVSGWVPWSGRSSLPLRILKIQKLTEIFGLRLGTLFWPSFMVRVSLSCLKGFSRSELVGKVLNCGESHWKLRPCRHPLCVVKVVKDWKSGLVEGLPIQQT